MSKLTPEELYKTRIRMREMSVAEAIKGADLADIPRIAVATLASMDKAEALHEWEMMEMAEFTKGPDLRLVASNEIDPPSD